MDLSTPQPGSAATSPSSAPSTPATQSPPPRTPSRSRSRQSRKGEEEATDNSIDIDGDNILPLTRHPCIALRKRTPKGRALYATGRIAARATIETCPVLVLHPEESRTLGLWQSDGDAEAEGRREGNGKAQWTVRGYSFSWPLRAARARGGDVSRQKTQALPLGLGSLFNHSRTPNVGWVRRAGELGGEAIVYTALRDIEEGEELCINYGPWGLKFEGHEGEIDADNVENEDFVEAVEGVDMAVFADTNIR